MPRAERHKTVKVTRIDISKDGGEDEATKEEIGKYERSKTNGWKGVFVGVRTYECVCKSVYACERSREKRGKM